MQTTNKPLKILVLSHISDIVGGAEMSMLDIFDEWHQKFNIQPEFILRKPIKQLAIALEERGWKYYELDYTFWSESNPSNKEFDVFKNALMNSQAVSDIKTIIETAKPDVVMTNSIVSPWAALAAHFAQVPHVWFVREYGDLDHGRVFEQGREATLRDIGNLSVLVAANSLTLEKHYRKYIPGHKMRTIYTPFNIANLHKKAEEPVASPFLKKDSLKLALIGTLAVSKGQLEVIEAIGILKQRDLMVELCLIGGNSSPEFDDSMHRLLDNYDIRNQIHLVGFQTSPLKYVRHADVGIMSSRKEAFGRVTFEYLALGKPVIGANSGATPEMVAEGKNGYLYKQGDPVSLADAIEHYARDPQLVQKHGKASKEKATDMMAGEHNADKLFDDIQTVLKKPELLPTIHYFERYVDYLAAANTYVSSIQANPLRYLRPQLRLVAKKAYHKAVRLKTKRDKIS